MVGGACDRTPFREGLRGRTSSGGRIYFLRLETVEVTGGSSQGAETGLLAFSEAECEEELG